jgi:type VI secretion system protein ImpI
MMLTTDHWVTPKRHVAAIEQGSPAMQLVFEVCDPASGELPARKVFDSVGGVIGRGMGCDWVIPDATRLISSHHGLISYRDDRYFLTDISSNGIGVSGSGERLRKGQARLISEGDVYQLGSLNIRARLLGHDPRPFTLNERIPEDAFLGLDPVQALDCEQRRRESSHTLEALDPSAESAAPSMGHGAVDRDHLVVPEWAVPLADVVPPPVPVTAAPETFWSQFGEALGMGVDTLDTPGREALAIKVAGLLRQTVDGLQHSLRTRDELNSEVNPRWNTSALKHPNPLKDCADTQAALVSLLGRGELGRLSAELTIAQAYRDLQVHQLALVVACRAALRSARVAFAPAHLLLCFERERKPHRFFTDGAHWRAYQRHYQRLNDEACEGEQLLRDDFTNAYEEQVRLVSTLHAAYPG